MRAAARASISLISSAAFATSASSALRAAMRAVACSAALAFISAICAFSFASSSASSRRMLSWRAADAAARYSAAFSRSAAFLSPSVLMAANVVSPPCWMANWVALKRALLCRLSLSCIICISLLSLSSCSQVALVHAVAICAREGEG